MFFGANCVELDCIYLGEGANCVELDFIGLGGSKLCGTGIYNFGGGQIVWNWTPYFWWWQNLGNWNV
jgi:hypothetical protein